MTTRDYSDKQEAYLAKLLDGRITPNSGGTKFSGGDVILDDASMLIEAKTTTKDRKSFAIKKEWIDKAKEQAFAQGLVDSSVAFQFEPEGDNYFILSEESFLEYMTARKEIYGN